MCEQLHQSISILLAEIRELEATDDIARNRKSPTNDVELSK